MTKKIRVVAVFAGQERAPGACEIYRITMPFHYLGQQTGWETGWIWLSNIWDRVRTYGPGYWAQFIDENDIFVFPRAYSINDLTHYALGGFFKIIRGAGKRIVYETDDDYTNDVRQVMDGDAMAVAQMADAITVTTPYLKERMWKYVKRPYYALPNCISRDDFCEGSMPNRNPDYADKIVIGLTGSHTHNDDWKVLGDVVPRVLDENPNVMFALMGYYPVYIYDHPRLVKIPAMPYNRYTKVLRTFDVVIAPVIPDDLFNLGKSPIKAIEGMAARRVLPNGRNGGAAVITTKNLVYSLAIKDYKTGLLVEHNEDAWYEALTRIVRDHELRYALQEKGHGYALKHHDIANEWRQWARAYKKVLASPANPSPIIIPEQFKEG